VPPGGNRSLKAQSDLRALLIHSSLHWLGFARFNATIPTTAADNGQLSLAALAAR